MKCRNCKYLRWAEEYPRMPFFGWCDEINDSPDMNIERKCYCFKPATNADVIRRMSDEEMAEFLADFKDCAGDCLVGKGVKDCSGICATRETLKMWLQQPAEEDT